MRHNNVSNVHKHFMVKLATFYVANSQSQGEKNNHSFKDRHRLTLEERIILFLKMKGTKSSAMKILFIVQSC